MRIRRPMSSRASARELNGGAVPPGPSLTLGVTESLTAPHAHDFLCRRRPAEQIALTDVAVMLTQKLHLFLMFHALGNHFEPERVAHGDDGRDDGRVPPFGYAHQKRPV